MGPRLAELDEIKSRAGLLLRDLGDLVSTRAGVWREREGQVSFSRAKLIRSVIHHLVGTK